MGGVWTLFMFLEQPLWEDGSIFGPPLGLKAVPGSSTLSYKSVASSALLENLDPSTSRNRRLGLTLLIWERHATAAGQTQHSNQHGAAAR